jgi:hypothetical protein
MSSQIYKIVIQRCNQPGYWYSKYIGKTFYAGTHNHAGNLYFKIVNDKLNNGKLCSINDASVLQKITKVPLY